MLVLNGKLGLDGKLGSLKIFCPPYEGRCMNDSKFEKSKTKNCISPSPILLDGQVDLHVEDDEAQEGQDHCEDKF